MTLAQLRAESVRTLQVNLGLRCNLRCAHCHLEASPERKEAMSRETMEAVLRAAARLPGCVVDLTGGAPELHPGFRGFVRALADGGLRVQVRTNLAVLLEPGLGDLPAFFRGARVALVGSLPCYLEENVRRQRGAGAFERAVEALRRLNAEGYALRPELPLDLVYNPGGPFLPPDERALEEAYRAELRARFGVEFNRLRALANMPLGRFREALRDEGAADDYRRLLERSYNPDVLPALMCRYQLSVGWDGRLHDCDFNLALGLGLEAGAPQRVEDFDPATLGARRIVTGEHCLGCTAGSGSSCGGSLAGPNEAARSAA